MNFSRILLVLAVSVGVLTLSSCGQDVCIAGIGSCGAYQKALDKNKDLQTSTGGSGGTAPTDRLAIGCKSWGQCWTLSGRSLELMASGGTPPYVFHVIDGDDKLINMSVLSITTSVKTKLRIRVTDATNQALTTKCDLCETEVTILPPK